MKFDRRQFFRISTAGAFAAAGCGGGGGSPPPPTTNRPSGLTGSGGGGVGAGPNLEVEFEGLYIIEGHGSNMKIHLVDGTKVGVTTHDAEMYVLEKDIDTSSSATSPADRIVSVGSDNRWFYSLMGHTV